MTHVPSRGLRRGEEDLSHVCSGGHSVRHVPSGRWGWRSQLDTGETSVSMYHVQMGEENLCSVTHVPSGGWERRGGSVPCTQWGTLSDTCPQWEMGRRGGSVPCTQWWTLTHTCPQWGVMEEKRSSGMYSVGDAQ